MSIFIDGIKNARIDSAKITVERGFVLCIYITVDYGGAMQSYGGYMAANMDKNEPKPYLDAYITGIMKTMKVSDWNNLKGQPIRVEVNDGLIVRIGHYLEDRWFSFKEANESVEMNK